MHYQLTTSTPTEPKVAEIIDCRGLEGFIAPSHLELNDNVQYISMTGIIYSDSGYEVTVQGSGTDFLLAVLDDGRRVVTNLQGLGTYMTRVGQADQIPEELG